MIQRPEARGKNGDTTTVAIGIALALATIGVYAPVLGHQFIDFDDDVYVTANPMVRAGWTFRGFLWAWTTGHAYNWHPLTWLSHLTDCSLFGLNPAGHHATSALLHAANAVLLFFLLRRMTGAVWRAAMAAALFALHPLHVESVAWVAERKDVLSALFFLLTIWAYIRYAEAPKVPGSRSKVFYGLSLLFFACGLMSKAMVVTLPFVLILLDYWPLERLSPAVAKRLALEKWPFFALSAADSVVTYLVQKNENAVSQGVPFYDRAGNAVFSYGRYLGRMVWPAHLTVIYPYSDALPRLELCLCLLMLAAVTWAVLKWRSRRYLAVGWFWYLGTLVPVIGLIQVGVQSSADRYTYIPLIGIFVMVVWGCADLARRWKIANSTVAAAGVCALTACAVATESQLDYWSDDGTLFGHALEVTTENAVAWNGMGIYLLSQREDAEAFRCFTKAAVAGPNNDAAWYNLGAYYWRHGRPEEALRCFSLSLRLRERPNTCCHVGLALAALHREAEAVPFFNRALGLDANYLPARMGLADTLADQGQNTEAVRQYQQVLQLAPDFEDAHCNLGSALAAEGHKAEAATEFQAALRLSPGDATAHCNLGNLLMDSGNLDAAAAEYRAALNVKPGSPEIHSNLGAVLARQGRRQEAMDEFNEALRIAPNFTQAKEQIKALQGRP